MEGRKDDQQKPRMDLIPPEAMDALSKVLTDGADRYGDRNWEQGMRWGRPFAALMRHMWAWWRGETTDPDSGRSHLWHALCCVAFLVAYEQRGVGEDNRPRQSRKEGCPHCTPSRPGQVIHSYQIDGIYYCCECDRKISNVLRGKT